MKHLLLLPLCTLLWCPSFAKKTSIKKHELYWSMGVLSLDQLKGFANNEPVGPYMSFPYAFTGAQSITYRYRPNKRFSVGATVVLDNQTGNLSYGDEHHGSLGGPSDGVSGRYDRHAYTFAAEATLIYIRQKYFRVSGFIGWGYSLAGTKYTFSPNIQYQQYFYGTPNSLVPTNPYTFNRGYYSYQITPVSLRFGSTVAGFFDIGFGYKGIFSGGVTVRL